MFVSVLMILYLQAWGKPSGEECQVLLSLAVPLHGLHFMEHEVHLLHLEQPSARPGRLRHVVAVERDTVVYGIGRRRHAHG